jgi:GAF domain-containing protein
VASAPEDADDAEERRMTTWVLVATATVALVGSLWVLYRQRRHEIGDIEAAIHDPERLAAVESLDIIGHPPIPELDELARRAASLLRTPCATISLLDADAQYFPGRFGLSGPTAVDRGGPSDEDAFSRHVVAADGTFQVGDAFRHPLLRDSRLATDRRIRAYLGVPLRTRDGYFVGVVSVFDTFARKWTADDHAELTRISQLAMRQLERSGAAHREPDAGVADPGPDDGETQLIAPAG